MARPGGPHCPEHAEAAAERRAEFKAKAKAKVSGLVWYRTQRWREAARAFLRRHPLCRDCAEVGLVEPATEVDHIEPHRGDEVRFWDRSNWQPLCKPCHSRKTAREVFGNPGGGPE